MEVDVLGVQFRVRLRQIRTRAVELEGAEVQPTLMGCGAGLRCGEKRGGECRGRGEHAVFKMGFPP
ncbi:hypothetical protein [Streptomyces sp. NPDC041003]|uniref:hypothetical protein n=1 Tax=Streptomyces sp. NPDC041003 TaxID=3155730 RepID=UPI0033F578C4